MSKAAAIRQALGLPADAAVHHAEGGGYLVHVTNEQADLAFNLARKLGDSATAVTFVTRGEDNTAIPIARGGPQIAGEGGRPLTGEPPIEGERAADWTTDHDWTHEVEMPSQALTDYNRCVVRGTHSERTENGTCVECGTCRADFGNSYEANADGELMLRETAPVDLSGVEATVCKRDGCYDLSGNAADRERYVTERAKFIGSAFVTACKRHLISTASLPDHSLHDIFRDLIDRGVLK